MKYRDNLPEAMAGPAPQGVVSPSGSAGGLQSAGRTQTLSFGVSSQNFDVALYGGERE